MEPRLINVQIKDVVESYPEGTTVKDIAALHQAEYPYDIVLAFVNGRLRELRTKIENDCDIEFITTGDPIGHSTYRRSMSFLLIKAIHAICDYSPKVKVKVQFSVSHGLYCTIKGVEAIDEEFLSKVKGYMLDLVDRDIPFDKRSMPLDDAIDLFGQAGMEDKKSLLEFRRASTVNVYSLGQFDDYYYGYMVASTGCLKYFDLYPFEDGLVLQMPVRKAPTEVPEFKPAKKLFDVLNKATIWGEKQQIPTVGALNELVTRRDPNETIIIQEAYHEKQIGDIAEKICENPKVKFVLIAGPSSSGKTTFSHRLSIQLRANGMVPHPIAVDNFFVEREDNPKDENGEYDFECLEAVDIKLFNDCMNRLLNGEEVVLPTFNFKTGHKEYNEKPKKLGKNDILVIEGIHCLNPKMTAELADESKFKVYISALTQLNVDEHNRIPTTDGRLLRRMVRDARTRGSSAKNTISMWPSVRRGEEQNIFPYQEEADVMFNSSLIYELAVIKPYVEPLLFGIEKDCPEYYEAKRLLKFLDYFVSIRSDYVPATSLLKEFIGGGCFKV